MEAWCKEKGLKGVEVFRSFPDISMGEDCTVIIANAARNHHKAIRWALAKHLPILVEKPVTLSFQETCLMGEIAEQNNTFLAAAHVFLFSHNIDRFCRLVLEKDYLKSIKFTWIDSKNEQRGGEIKSFDASLPIYLDCLPHVVSIISMIAHERIKITGLKLSSGGSNIVIFAKIKNIPCTIQLVRNGTKRQRLIEVATDLEKLSIDFTEDPGIIYVGDDHIPNNLLLEPKNRPVSRMLMAFFNSIYINRPDVRLDFAMAKKSNRIIDEVHSYYETELSLWLEKKLRRIRSDQIEDLKYALKEIISKHDLVSQVHLDTKLTYLLKRLENDFDKNFSVPYKKSALNFIENLIEEGIQTSYSV